MGTMVQRRKLSEADFRGERFAAHPRDLKGNNDVLVLTRPDVIAEIHAEYLEAGADIIETNTFTATSGVAGRLRPRGDRLRAQPRGRALARRVADEWTAKTPDQPRFVAGSLGPTNRTLSISPDVNNPAFRAVTFDEMRAGLRGPGARPASTAARTCCWWRRRSTRSTPRRRSSAIEEVFERHAASRLPLMISATITDRSGRTLSGQTLDAFYLSIEHARPFSVGLNCALGAREMRPYLAELARIVDLLRQLLSQRRPAQRVRPVRRAARRDRRGCCASSPTAASSTSSAAAAARRRITSARWPGRVAGLRPRPRPAAADSAVPRAVALLGAGNAGHPAGQQFPDDRRAHQRHRLEEDSSGW